MALSHFMNLPMANINKSYFLTRDKKLHECEVVKTSPHRREVRMIEGPQAGQVVAVHPEGVAWGQMYPRLFNAPRAPKGVFVHQGRAMVHVDDEEQGLAVPGVNPHYRFQPFLKDVIDCVHGRENVILTGGTGVGKTTHVTQLAARVGQPLLRINFNGETRIPTGWILTATGSQPYGWGKVVGKLPH